MTGVNAQLYVDFYSFIKLSLSGLQDHVQSFVSVIELAAVYELCALNILFTFAHDKYPPLVVNSEPLFLPPDGTSCRQANE